MCPAANTPAGCVIKDCGPPVNATGTTICPNLTRLTSNTTFTLEATCVKQDGSKGPASPPDTFSTPAQG